jgi:hypothetical protein
MSRLTAEELAEIRASVADGWNGWDSRHWTDRSMLLAELDAVTAERDELLDHIREWDAALSEPSLPEQEAK